jgi:hypothetical protein
VDLRDREKEVGRLQSLAAAAACGDGMALLIEGPAGIGKTALLDAAREHGRRAGLRILTARGGELEWSFPYSVARQLLDRFLFADGLSAEPAGDGGRATGRRDPDRSSFHSPARLVSRRQERLVSADSAWDAGYGWWRWLDRR